MSKHSERPWRYTGGDDGFVLSGDSDRVCQTFDKFECDFANADGNGPILAAAPDMLAELERLAESFGWGPEHPACQIIRKARGEA